MKKPALLPLMARYADSKLFDEIVPLSALDGDGVELLARELWARLPEGPPLYDPELVTLHPERFLVAERIREQVLRHTRDELPFATAVLIDSWEDDPQRELVRILATILVEREGQRAIVIGRDGQPDQDHLHRRAAGPRGVPRPPGVPARHRALRAAVARVARHPRSARARSGGRRLCRGRRPSSVGTDERDGAADGRRRGSAGRRRGGLSMRILSGEAILLDAIDLQERDRIVTFLTAEWGRKRGVARGARAKFSRFAGQLQPLSKVAVRWFEKEGRELVRIESVELIEPCRALLEDLDGILLASYLAEHLVCFAQENEDSESFYRLLDGTLRWIEQGVDRDLAARYFEVWVLRLAGIFPPPRECPVCGRSLVDAGGAVDRPRRPRDPLPRLRRRSRGETVGGRGRVPAAHRARGAAGDRGRRAPPPPCCARSSAPAPRCAPASCTRSCAATR